MALSIFDDKARQPNESDLTEALGKTKRLWDDLKKHVAEDRGQKLVLSAAEGTEDRRQKPVLSAAEGTEG